MTDGLQELVSVSTEGDPLVALEDELRRETNPQLLARYAQLFVQNQVGPGNPREEDPGDLVDRVVYALAVASVLEASSKETRAVIEAAIGDMLTSRQGYMPDPPQHSKLEADPVLMLNGEFIHETEDLRINGAGMDFVFRRTYRNQAAYYGPLGVNWDHAFNLHLRASETQVTLSSGELREHVYTRHPRYGEAGFTYFVPPDGVHTIFQPQGDPFSPVSFTLRSPEGVRHVFEPDPDWSEGHRLRAIEDRFGNGLLFFYRDARLDWVLVNHPDRVVRFAYDSLGRIVAITDYVGRTWRYEYDDFGDLVAVTTPASGQYPNGLTTRFEYSTALSSGLSAHNLVRIIDPLGRIYLENEYGESPGRSDFRRVIRQRQGSGESVFEYEDVIPDSDLDYSDSLRPAHQTNFVDRNGHQIHFIYNAFGNLLQREESIFQDGHERVLVWRYRYNRDGSLTATMSPEGVVTQYLLGREYFMRRLGLSDGDPSALAALTAAERQGFGRTLATVRRGRYYDFSELNLAPGVWGDVFPDILGVLAPADIVVKSTYEPVYGQPLSVSDPRSTKGADPEHPESDGYLEGLTIYEYRGPPSDPTLLLTRIVRPKPTLPDGTPAGPVIEEFPAHDGRGRVLRHVDPAGTVTEYEYFTSGDGRREGYLRRTIVDPGQLQITTEHEVDELGRVIAVHLPRSVGALPGHFISRTRYNELDQVMESALSPPFHFRTLSFYDPNGKLSRMEVEAKDEAGADVPGAPVVHTFAYDEQLNLVRETRGGIDLGMHLVTSHAYDASGRRIRTALPVRHQIRLRYDERLLPIAQTRGAGSPEAATSRTEYDGDGRVQRIRNARGQATAFRLDPFGRVIAQEDPLGNIGRRTYDKLGNLTLERTFQRQADGSFLLLARSEFAYDPLGHEVQTRRNRFDDPLPAGVLEDAFLASPGPGAQLVTQTFYDPKGRVVRVVDPMGRERRYTYDALDRVVSENDALGNRIERRYDAHGNLVRTDRRDLVRDSQTGAVVGERVFASSSTYDQLDRRTTDTDSLGNVTQLGYDSRGNLVRRVDPLGNVTRADFDIFGRRSANIHELTAVGLGGVDPISTLVTRFEYDANGNRTAVVDALGRRISYELDALDRVRSVTYPEGSQKSFAYDTDGNVVFAQDNNGSRRRFTVDAAGRPIRVDLDTNSLASDPLVEGSTYEAYEYDALGRRIGEENDFARCEIRFNSLGWPIGEKLTIATPIGPPLGPLEILRSFNDAGAVTGLIYPGGRTLRYERDPLDRITRIENGALGDHYPGSPATPSVSEIASFDYAGKQRRSCTLSNGTTMNYGHDAGGRLIDVAVRSGPESVLVTQCLYDSVGNARFRNDIETGATSGEILSYDSLYQLVRVQSRDDLPHITSEALGPYVSVPLDPIPNRQGMIDGLIGVMALTPGTETWTYDAAGNRVLERTEEGATHSYIPNELDQYTPVDGIRYEYDRNGNLTSDGTRGYRYDSLNRLVRVVDLASGHDSDRFLHDARGRRVAEVRSGLPTYLVPDGWQLLAEYRDGQPSAQYVHEEEVDRPVLISAEGTEHWYHADQFGSVRLLTSEDGIPDRVYRYSPFGEFIGAPPMLPYNRFRYSAHWHDEAVAAYDFRAREYSPSLGRFLQRDPADPVDQGNPYTYAGSNPLTYRDPFGSHREERGPAQPSREDDLSVVLYLKSFLLARAVLRSVFRPMDPFGQHLKGYAKFWSTLKGEKEAGEALGGYFLKQTRHQTWIDEQLSRLGPEPEWGTARPIWEKGSARFARDAAVGEGWRSFGLEYHEAPKTTIQAGEILRARLWGSLTSSLSVVSGIGTMVAGAETKNPWLGFGGAVLGTTEITGGVVAGSGLILGAPEAVAIGTAMSFWASVPIIAISAGWWSRQMGILSEPYYRWVADESLKGNPGPAILDAFSGPMGSY